MSASRAALTREDLRVKISVQKVRLDGVEHRVISPAGPLRNGALYHRSDNYDMFVDRSDGRRIGTLWLLAARSPHTLVHLPMRATADEEPPGGGWRDEKPVDLVLAHRAVQFRPSRWKRLRERLRAANAPRELRTASVPGTDLPERVPPEDRDPVHISDSAGEDVLHQHRFAETLFLTGTTTALREGAKEFFEVTREGPPHAATQLQISGACNYHVCRGLYYWNDLHDHGWDDFHLEYCPTWKR
ncbi:hypothetical protein HUT18_19845 [Streptomyces sp. NA04227]|uniref:hypothetical protein n=1 Tax=Streptomyces sp. NA04227 TaxID=2742136 RepID=UPI001591ABFD|nr:hypothetical protein [Streptomyces sp. NA04227]QKW08289.1 hypothetical protein HUT18_19845 [Streptomyces sp. NA04227]